MGVLFVWAAASSVSYHPHHMSYFNETIGPRVNGWRFLADSNPDWEDRGAHSLDAGNGLFAVALRLLEGVHEGRRVSLGSGAQQARTPPPRR